VADVLAAYLDAERPTGYEPQPVDFGCDYIDGQLLFVHQTNGSWRDLLSSNEIRNVEKLANELSSHCCAFSNPLEKALFQRDLFQLFSSFHRATVFSSDADLTSRGKKTLDSLARLMMKTLLTREELSKLHQMLPEDTTEAGFQKESPFRSTGNYLPTRVVKEEESWLRLPLPTEATAHSNAFRGRSFISVFFKQPGLDKVSLEHHWQSILRQWKDPRTVVPQVQWKAAGLETMLVRSFGVFLQDMTFVDSRFPEEVLIRAFKYDLSTLDPESSDFRGTQQYQYKMRRRALLANPKSLGLQRIQEDDRQFLGFFSESPDAFNVGTRTLTSMRFNCISCHSTASYGIDTIFSLRRSPVVDEKKVSGHIALEIVDASLGLYKLRSAEAQALAEYAADYGAKQP
jgi:hypothetical protein